MASEGTASSVIGRPGRSRSDAPPVRAGGESFRDLVPVFRVGGLSQANAWSRNSRTTKEKAAPPREPQ